MVDNQFGATPNENIANVANRPDDGNEESSGVNFGT